MIPQAGTNVRGQSGTGGARLQVPEQPDPGRAGPCASLPKSVLRDVGIEPRATGSALSVASPVHTLSCR